MKYKRKVETAKLQMNHYCAEDFDSVKGYSGRLSDPEFTDELYFWVAPDMVCVSGDEFAESGMDQIHIGGSSRALFELGRFIIGLSKLERDDPEHHVHIRESGSLSDIPANHIIIHHSCTFE